MRFIALALVTFQVSAWNAAGHRIVALIASDQFTEAEHKKISAKMGDWVSMASEPDQYREISNALSKWHYIDYPWVVEPVVKPIQLVEKDNNIVWALKESKKALSKRSAKSQDALIQIFRANLVHLMGDIHQPLHNISRVTEVRPKGDMGGNLFDIKVDGKSMNLHHFWDGGCGLLESLNLERVAELARQIQKEFPRSALKIEGSFEDWSKDSFFIAQKHVYLTPENGAVSLGYTDQGQKVVKERLALAGYRLARELRELFFYKRAGFKLTRPREIIINELMRQKSHINAEKLLEMVRRVEPKIGLSTVYRTLKMLQECGLVKAHYFADSQALFELETDPDAHHDHLICERCRRIDEFIYPELEALQLQIAKRHGFRLTNHRMELYGICKACEAF